MTDEQAMRFRDVLGWCAAESNRTFKIDSSDAAMLLEALPLTPSEAGAIQAVSEVEMLRRERTVLRAIARDWRDALEADDAVCTCEDYDTCPLCRVKRVTDGPIPRVFTEAEVREVLQQVRTFARSDLRVGGLSTTDYGNAAGREDACDSIAQSLNLTMD